MSLTPRVVDKPASKDLRKVFEAVQCAVGGERLEDGMTALIDSLAIILGFAAEDLADADGLIAVVAGDLREAVRRYAPEIAEAKALGRHKQPAGQA